jgi:aspartate kinase
MRALMDIVVQKYGGTSLATLELLHRAAGRVHAARQAGRRVVVVVSARGGTTDELLRLADEVNPDRPAREIDQLLVTGENASSALLAMALHARGVPAVSLTGHQTGIRATGEHGTGRIAEVDTARIERVLADGTVAVVAGFQGVNADGEVVTLGRGGSDTTAVALATVLGASVCEIYTDVDGIYTADPRIVRNARLLPFVDGSVMAEMAFAGARVMHSRAVEIAAMNSTDVHVRNTATDNPGTVIRGERNQGLESRGAFVAITHDLDVARVLVRSSSGPGDLAADVLEVLARRPVPVDLIARSGPHEDEFRMGFTVPRSHVAEIEPALRDVATRLGGRVDVNSNVGKVSLIGMGLLNRPGYALRLLAALNRDGIGTSWVSATQLRVSVTVPRDEVMRAVSLLHREFELERIDTGAGTAATA